MRREAVDEDFRRKAEVDDLFMSSGELEVLAFDPRSFVKAAVNGQIRAQIERSRRDFEERVAQFTGDLGDRIAEALAGMRAEIDALIESERLAHEDRAEAEDFALRAAARRFEHLEGAAVGVGKVMTAVDDHVARLGQATKKAEARRASVAGRVADAAHVLECHAPPAVDPAAVDFHALRHIWEREKRAVRPTTVYEADLAEGGGGGGAAGFAGLSFSLELSPHLPPPPGGAGGGGTPAAAAAEGDGDGDGDAAAAIRRPPRERGPPTSATGATGATGAKGATGAINSAGVRLAVRSGMWWRRRKTQAGEEREERESSHPAIPSPQRPAPSPQPPALPRPPPSRPPAPPKESSAAMGCTWAAGSKGKDQ